MTESKDSYEKSTKTAIAYSIGQIPEVGMYQYFNMFVFTFYFFVVGLNIIYIVIGFVIWSIWNAINDPLIGALSDRTRSKYGRRKPWIIGGVIPVLFILVLVFAPPVGSQLIIFIYFLIVILLFETFFSMYGINWLSLLPEMYENLEDRSKVMQYVIVCVFVSMITAVIIPTFFIPDYKDPQYRSNYAIATIFMVIFFAFWAFIFIKWGLKEKPEFSQDAHVAPSIFTSFKYSFKSKSFKRYVVANFSFWFAIGLGTVGTAYTNFVIGVSDTRLIALLSISMLVVMALCAPLWKKITLKIGVKNALILSFSLWSISFLPYLFIEDYISSLILSAFAGVGISGVSYLQRIVLAVIVDEDELKTGVRREAGFWGINYFVTRLATVVVFLSIGLIFASTNWIIYGGEASVTPDMIFGLRLLRSVIPFTGIMIGVVFLFTFPLTKEVSAQIAQDARKLHAEKKAKISG